MHPSPSRSTSESYRCLLHLEPLEPRLLLSLAAGQELLLAGAAPGLDAPGSALLAGPADTTGGAVLHDESVPTKSGQVFVIDDWDSKVTKNDLGFNYFSGNCGTTETTEGITTIAASNESNGSTGGSLDVSFNFAGQPTEAFAGYFASLFGLTDTLVSLDGSGTQPSEATEFPGYFLDTQNIYGKLLPFAGRSVEQLRFDVRQVSDSGQPVTLKIELRDEPDAEHPNGFDVFTRYTLGGDDWQTVTLSLPSSFTRSVEGNGNTSAFDWGKVSRFSLIVERRNVADGVANPDSGGFLVDNLDLVDTDGQYPDLAAMQDQATGGLDPSHEKDFLNYVREISSAYFLDFASTDPRTGGIIQDRSSFADLMSVGGVGFQLPSYVIDAQRGYETRDAAATQVLDILRVLANQPQGSDRVGTIGYQGFFYHFLGIDGLRRQNFDFTATPENEALTTVELSTIDTALAIAGVVTAGQYFDGNSPVETEIRTLANEIYGRVNWSFMLDTAAGPNQNQFYLGWKPNETRGGEAFEIPDGAGQGQYSGSPGSPQTLDYYTDEGLLVALLAMGSPNPAHRLGREVWDAMVRDDAGGSFVRTYPGSLFTYQFFSVWNATQWLGTDSHPTQPVDFFENTRDAIQATIGYAVSNPEGHATLNQDRWGLSAAEGPYDDYVAWAAPTAALAAGTSELGTVTNYAVGASILHDPADALRALWDAAEHEDLNADGSPELLNPRFGFADAYDLQIADALVPGLHDPADPEILRSSGAWANFTGFAIDQGSMLVMIDNYLGDNFVPRLFMSNPGIAAALQTLFPDADIPFPQDRLVGTKTSGSVQVLIYDMTGPVDVNPNDVQVAFGRNNSVQSVTLRGTQPMDGLGLAISGATSVGPINDARTGAPAIRLEGESGTGFAQRQPRSNASHVATAWLTGTHLVDTLSFTSRVAGYYDFHVRYSNDGAADTIQVSLDGVPIGSPFLTQDTRPPGGAPGSGWNQFAWTDSLASIPVAAGHHTLTVSVLQTDAWGVEIDRVDLTPTALGALAFIASDAPIDSVRLKSGLAGYDINGATFGSLTLPADIDGDGDLNDPVSLWTPGRVKSIDVAGPWAGGASAAWIGTAKAGGSFGVDLRLAGADPRGVSLGTLQAGHAANATVSTPGLITSIKAVDWQDGSISANSLGSLTTTGGSAGASPSRLPGDFGADLALAGANLAPRAATLGSVKIAGSLVGGQWSVPGKTGAVAIGHVLAPITLGDVASISTSSPLVREVQGGVPVGLIAVETVDGAARASRIQFHSIARWPRTLCDHTTTGGTLVPGDVLGSMTLASLKNHFVSSGLGTWTGDPSKLKPGLLASFGTSNDPTYKFVKGTAFIYDEALAIEALLEGAAPDAESRARAFQIADALVLLHDHDPLNASAVPDPTFPELTPAPLRDRYLSGVVADSRTSTRVIVRPDSSNAASGNQAYVALALQRAADVAGAAGDADRAADYLRTAKELLLYVGRNREKPGPLEGFRMSDDPAVGQARSTENNIDLAMAFGRAAATETAPALKTQWEAWRDWAAYFVNQMYGGNVRFGALPWISDTWQYFHAGTGLGDDINPDLIPIDSGAWCSLQLGDHRDVAFDLLEFLATSRDAKGRVYTGFDPGFRAVDDESLTSRRDGVGTEATAYLALIARKLGDTAILAALPARDSLTPDEQASYDVIVSAAAGASDQDLANWLVGGLAEIQLHAPNTDVLGLVAAPARNVGTGEYSLVNAWSLASTCWARFAFTGWDIFSDSLIA